ncbi:MAG: HAD-IIB family hydrolase [Acholeplasmatales bacterium]|nr:HAD-IIB family hydrolase [Acholeplasmatales bacterium]
MKILYVSDLDGTLLDKDTKLSDYTIEELNKLIDDGLMFTYATARSYNSAKVVSSGIKIKYPVILCNGVKIYDTLNKKTIFSTFFSDKDKELVKNICLKYDILPILYQTKDDVDKFYYLNYNISEGKQYYLDKRKDDKRLTIVNSKEELFSKDSIYYFNFIDTYENLKPIYDELKNHFRCVFQQEIYREEYWLEVLPNNSDKAESLIKLKELLNVDKIVYFGDSVNDISSFKVSDLCYAVENSKEELKPYATKIIGSNNTDGVIKQIKEMYKNESF